MHKQDVPADLLDLDMLEGDEYADLLGHICWSTPCVRLRRNLWLASGWPHRACGMLDEAWGHMLFDARRWDEEWFAAYSVFEGNAQQDDAVVQRHLFHPVTCQQLSLDLNDCEAGSSTISEELRSVLKAILSG